MPVKMPVKLYCKKYLLHSLLSVLSLLSLLSLIFINKIDKTNGMPILKLLKTNSSDKIINNYNNEIERIKTTEVLDKNYTINGTIIKQSIIYDDTLNNFIGEVLIYYNNTYHKNHKHFYCKINIIIPTQVNASYITEYIYYYYNFDKTITLICNEYDCLELFNYNGSTNQNVYYKCNILDNIQLKDEF
jgi:hypothetical protein